MKRDIRNNPYIFFCQYLFEVEKLDTILCGNFLWNKQSEIVQLKCGFRDYSYEVTITRMGTVEKTRIRIITEKNG